MGNKQWIVNLIGIVILVVLTTITEVKAGDCVKQYTSYSKTKNIKSLRAELVKPTLTNTIILHHSKLREEGDIYPSNDLYEDTWNTEILKAYADIGIPDSFVVNVSDLVFPIEGKVTSCFGPRGAQFHYGTDIRLKVGDTIRVAFDGKVRVMKYEREGYGYYLVVRHFNGLETVYAHLSKFIVTQGKNVKAGEPIALGGNTGRSTGPHLHFEFRFLGIAINTEEIIDFDELAIKNDTYTYRKGNQNYFDSNHSINQWGYVNEMEKITQYHQIIKGDTLYSISKRYGVAINKLCEINQISPESILCIGSSIRIL